MTSQLIPVLAIDGPSGVGKGTVSMRLAALLGWHVLDSGAIYRALAVAAMQRNIALDQALQLAELAQCLALSFIPPTTPDGIQKILLDGVESSQHIRSEVSGNAASQLAVLPLVRQALLVRQRAFAQPPGLVADGRDMGTVVFPHALCKIFLTATEEERAKRRLKQLKEKGNNAKLDMLICTLRERDRRDRERASAPLMPAEDAHLLDTSALTIIG